MTETISISVELMVDDSVSEDRACAAVDALLEELIEDERYLNIKVMEDDTVEHDDVARLLNMLDIVDESALDDAMESARRLDDE